MFSMDIELITETAIIYREAIERCRFDLGLTFKRFPRGSCGDATPLLGSYFIDLRIFEFDYYCGDYGSHADGTWSSHAWLQKDDIVVDITADQFQDVNDKVIVSTNSDWHRKLNGKGLHIADYRVYDGFALANLAEMYKRICQEIEKHNKFVKHHSADIDATLDKC